MAGDVTRADVLRTLIGRVEGGSIWFVQPNETRHFPDDFRAWACSAGNTGVLDAVARLEVPLRERGWIGPFVAPSLDGDGITVEWGRGVDVEPDDTDPMATAPTEPRARLLAVLRCHLHEEEPHHEL